MTNFPTEFPADAAAKLTGYFFSGLTIPDEHTAEAAWTLLGYGLHTGYNAGLVHHMRARAAAAHQDPPTHAECGASLKVAAAAGGSGVQWEVLIPILVQLIEKFVLGA